MKCSQCGGVDFERPVEFSALEIWTCEGCGSEMAVHCHYLPDISRFPKQDWFTGKFLVREGPNATKSYLKLKRFLSGCERFDPSRLQKQFLSEALEWDLGLFPDFEVKRLTKESVAVGIQIEFDKVPE
ncbi:hypothetical protein ABL840_18275 [Variovorax sp. NFACC27]|uniref:hypothetical protein n=1 Tax=unclassified Variovorax TaxID=663243 RepID=UPI00089798E3|nr:hypothetical protein SAMN03159371_06501 [Variovorax sp. NFACC28]SEG97202.1 hypothetical protein SAMN03159365_06788 [Variovorax sp. NFACC29]SFD89145.1 hypothetical protein SAMN03159379_06641 [Variovorax sp. NFACC26]SFH17029.1 hypothetical protein SAMN03159447_07032 [Variovorax sp. NFACC27]